MGPRVMGWTPPVMGFDGGGQLAFPHGFHVPKIHPPPPPPPGTPPPPPRGLLPPSGFPTAHNSERLHQKDDFAHLPIPFLRGTPRGEGRLRSDLFPSTTTRLLLPFLLDDHLHRSVTHLLQVISQVGITPPDFQLITPMKHAQRPACPGYISDW